MPKSDRIQLLLTHCRQHNERDRLIEILQHLRPHPFQQEFDLTQPEPDSEPATTDVASQNPRQIFVIWGGAGLLVFLIALIVWSIFGASVSNIEPTRLSNTAQSTEEVVVFAEVTNTPAPLPSTPVTSPNSIVEENEVPPTPVTTPTRVNFAAEDEEIQRQILTLPSEVNLSRTEHTPLEINLSQPEVDQIRTGKFVILISFEAHLDWVASAGSFPYLGVVVNDKYVTETSSLKNKENQFTINYQATVTSTHEYLDPTFETWRIFYSPDYDLPNQKIATYQVIEGNATTYVFDISDYIQENANEIKIEHCGFFHTLCQVCRKTESGDNLCTNRANPHKNTRNGQGELVMSYRNLQICIVATSESACS